MEAIPLHLSSVALQYNYFNFQRYAKSALHHLCCLSKIYVPNWILLFFKYSEWEDTVCHQEKNFWAYFLNQLWYQFQWKYARLYVHIRNCFSLCFRVRYSAMFLLLDTPYNTAGTTWCFANVSKDSCHML